MRIVITHLTRMGAPRICVAGIQPDTGRHVRPTTPPTDPITRSLLEPNGGPFALGAVVDLGQVTPVPAIPESEDHRFRTVDARRVAHLEPEDYLELVDGVGQADVAAIFGSALEFRGRNFAVERGRGETSLGVLRPDAQPELVIDGFGSLRVRFAHGEGTASPRVGDIRFFDRDHKTLRHEAIDDVRRRLHQGVPAILMVGLARAFPAQGDTTERHWLQVNGLCLEDRPLSWNP